MAHEDSWSRIYLSGGNAQLAGLSVALMTFRKRVADVCIKSVSTISHSVGIVILFLIRGTPATIHLHLSGHTCQVLYFAASCFIPACTQARGPEAIFSSSSSDNSAILKALCSVGT